MSSKHLGRFLKYDVYWLLASHYLAVLDRIVDLDTLDFTFNDYVFNGEICTTGSLFFRGSLLGRVDVSVNYPKKDLSIVLYGDKGTIQFNPLIEKSLFITLYNRRYAALPEELISSCREYSYDESNNLRFAMEYFDKLIDGKVLSNVDTAIKITKILQRGI